MLYVVQAYYDGYWHEVYGPRSDWYVQAARSDQLHNRGVKSRVMRIF